jgi:hypothetical protein
MRSFKIQSTSLITAAFTLLLLLPAAKDDGCLGEDVVIGDDGVGGEGAAGGGGSTGTCFVGGCSGQLCTDDPNAASTCEWTDDYACYQAYGICEADANGQCGWRPTPELEQCLASDGREPVEGGCAKDRNDACTSDADCEAGGCGGELCYNPALGEGVSTCECTAPQVTGCGCVDGSCSWYDTVQ